MRELLTMEVVLAALLVSSFTIVGVVALWAATSPGPWFVRAIVVIGILLPLLLIPAYEPFLTLALEAAFVVAGVRAWRSRHTATKTVSSDSINTGAVDAGRPKSLQFSLVTLLWMTAIAAIAVAIGARIVKDLPPQNAQAWITIALNGFASGAAVLVGAWLAASKRKFLAVPAVILMSLLLGLALIWQDWLVISILQQYGWPPDSRYWQQLQQVAAEYLRNLWLRSAAVNIASMVLTSLAVGLTAWLWTTAAARRQPAAGGEIRDARHQTGSQFAAKAACAGLMLMALFFPAVVVWELLNPLPIPRVDVPNPNGYDDIVAAGKAIQGGSPILNTMVEPKSTDELAAEIAKFKPVFDRIRLGLSRPSQVRVWPADGNFAGNQNVIPFADIQALRAVGRALSREAELAQQQGRYSDAATIAIENMHYSQACARGGLLINYLIAVAIEGVGQYSLYPSIKHLSPETCRDVILALEAIEAEREPLDDLRRREQIWEENAYGWHGHLQVFLQRLTNTYGANYENVRQDVLPKTQAINRLMMIELALRHYHSATDAWPETLNELAPKFVSEVPIDPFDPEGRELRYVRTKDNFLLYSVGYDGDDDGGRPPANEGLGTFIDWRTDGDLRLDIYFENMLAADAAEAEAEAAAEDEETGEPELDAVE
jgi:hypothetical protein